MRRIRVFSFLLVLAATILPTLALAQDDPQYSREVRAVVREIRSDTVEDGFRQMEFVAEDQEGTTYDVDTGDSYVEGLRYDIKVGDTVILQVLPEPDGGETAYLADVVRTDGLLLIAAFFALLTVAVGLWRGLFALVGLAVTVSVIFFYVIPQILGGADPVLVTVLGAIGILGVNMHLAHGYSRGTLVAFASTVFGLILAIAFSHAFVAIAKLSGLASEEAAFLFWQDGGVNDPRGLLLAGIILGASGVLDDIAITQGEIVAELADTNPSFGRNELFRRAMRIGRHHIASTVNTLVLAYVGVGLPLFLLFASSSVGPMDFVNTELVAEEIVRTLAGTAALVLTVPISTWLAARARSNPVASGKTIL